MPAITPSHRATFYTLPTSTVWGEKRIRRVHCADDIGTHTFCGVKITGAGTVSSNLGEGQQCRKCFTESRRGEYVHETIAPGPHVYVMHSQSTGLTKVGFSVSVFSRVVDHRVDKGIKDLTTRWFLTTPFASSIETVALHILSVRFPVDYEKQGNCVGEWFLCPPGEAICAINEAVYIVRMQAIGFVSRAGEWLQKQPQISPSALIPLFNREER